MSAQKDTIVQHVRDKMLKDASVLEIVVGVMEEVEQIAGLSGPDKRDYVIEVVLDICHVETDREAIKDMIEIAIKLSKGLYDINKKTGMFKCCFRT